jgi:hypothetical protein
MYGVRSTSSGNAYGGQGMSYGVEIVECGVQRGSKFWRWRGGRGRRSWRRGQIKGGNPGKVMKGELQIPARRGSRYCRYCRYCSTVEELEC